jgi:hypothetical protein
LITGVKLFNFTKRASVPLQAKLAAASQHWFMTQFEMKVKGVVGGVI